MLERAAESRETPELPSLPEAPEGAEEGQDTALFRREKAIDPEARVDAKSLQALSAQSRARTLSYARECSDETHARELEALQTGEDDTVLREFDSPFVAGGHVLETGQVQIRKNLDNSQAEHVLDHENLHRCSFQSFAQQETGNAITEVRTSGIRIHTEVTDKETGETEIFDQNRALNEGITEMETLRMERQVHGELRDCGFRAYEENVGYASRLEYLVGRDTLQDAYYNGRLDTLAEAVNSLSEDPEGWCKFSSDVDLVCSSRWDKSEAELAQMDAAKERLELQLLTMARNKGKEA